MEEELSTRFPTDKVMQGACCAKSTITVQQTDSLHGKKEVLVTEDE
jgi:hypothetical protein